MDEGMTFPSTYALDSAAHPTHISHPTPQLHPLSHTILTQTASNELHPCTHAGQMTIYTSDTGHPLTTSTVVNPAINHNLLSVRDLATRYGLVTFTKDRGDIIDTRHKPHRTVATATWNQGLYKIEAHNRRPSVPAKSARSYKITRRSNKPASTMTKATPPTHTKPSTSPPTKPKGVTRRVTFNNTPTIIPTTRIHNLPAPNKRHSHTPQTHHYHNWHLILNHVHPSTINKMAKLNTLPKLPPALKQPPPTITCSSCPPAKLHPAPHKTKQHDYLVGEYISSDTCGPITPKSRQGSQHILTFICAQSRFALLYFLKNRNEVGSILPQIFSHITNIQGSPPKHFRSDNAKEYQSNRSMALYRDIGIQYHHTTPHQPQENSIAERLNRTLLSAARAALHHAQLDDTHWEDAVRDVAFKYNLTYHTATQHSPYQLWHQQTPPPIPLFPFGQLGHIPDYSPKKKLQHRAHPARYLYGISLTHIMIHNLKTNACHTIRNVDFKPYHKHADPTITFATANKTVTLHRAPHFITPHTPPPLSRQQARKYPDAAEWEIAHNSELDILEKQHTFEWVPTHTIHPKTKLIPLMMLYRYKRSPQGDIMRRKARCNVRGDKMIPHLHYDPMHTTAYMADKSTIRLILAMAAHHGYAQEHFDINSAYLHENYKHKTAVYIQQMPKFDGTLTHPGQVGKLKGNLYGTPPAAHYYFMGLRDFLTSNGFQQCHSDPCLFIRHMPQAFVLISTSMDDFLVTATNQQLITETYELLTRKYSIKRLGKPTQFLNWAIKHLPTGAIHVSQPHAIQDLLTHANMQDCNGKQSPYADTKPLDKQADTPLLPHKKLKVYQQLVGDLRYITDSTRPDIYYITNRLAQYMQHPREHHWQNLKSVLRYLKQTAHHGLTYKPMHNTTHPNIVTYSDADYANAKDFKSITGTLHLYHKAPISWHSKKQDVVAQSTTEAEYVAASNALQHTQWLRRLLQEITQHRLPPSPHHIDNMSAIHVALNTSPTKRRRYIQIKHHHLNHSTHTKDIAIAHCPTKDMLADGFTKPLPPTKFKSMRNHLNIHALPAPLSDTGDCSSA